MWRWTPVNHRLTASTLSAVSGMAAENPVLPAASRCHSVLLSVSTMV